MSILAPLAIACIGGFIPALVWLWFWLKEDEAPEPRHLLLLAFAGGMLAIPVALALEKLLLHTLQPATISGKSEMLFINGSLLIGSAFIEECVKLLAVLVFIFWRREYDEPADAMVYLITAALGFAALENALYLQRPFALELFQGFTVLTLRFIGATLLHALSSGLLGFFIAESFYQKKLRKEIALFIGLIFATLLHTFFNLSILVTGSWGNGIEPALAILATSGILILFSFERIKHTI